MSTSERRLSIAIRQTWYCELYRKIDSMIGEPMRYDTLKHCNVEKVKSTKDKKN